MCREYGTSLNLDKCAFMVFSRMILGLINSKKGKLPYQKKIQAIINMPPPKNPQQIQIFDGMTQFTNVLSKKLLPLWHLSLN
jgi:hypothetical protein